MLGNITQQQVLQNVQQRLLSLRGALDQAAQLYAWTSTVSSSDLQALGFSAADAAAILSAAADANALNSFYTTGQPPGTYPQAASAYVYGASQRVVIGPQ